MVLLSRWVSFAYLLSLPGRFAMIDNGMGLQLVPWRQDLERHLGQEVAGRINARGRVEWSFARSRGPVI